MAISAQLVKELREKTGAGMMDCQKALNESAGDMEKAIDVLRKKGLASAQKKAGRAAAEGTVASYIHMGGKTGVLVEVNCETDFAARSQDFELRRGVEQCVRHLRARFDEVLTVIEHDQCLLLMQVFFQ